MGKTKTNILCSKKLFSYNHVVCEIMWKNIVELGKLRWQYGACAFYVAYLRLQTHTLGICNTCFSSATMVARKRFSVTSYVNCLSCLTSVSKKELQLIDPLAHWYRLFKIRLTKNWIDCLLYKWAISTSVLLHFTTKISRMGGSVTVRIWKRAASMKAQNFSCAETKLCLRGVRRPDFDSRIWFCLD